MSLSHEQRKFAKFIGILINYIYACGFSVTFGDAWSLPRFKAHSKNSKHYDRLAIDLNLFDSLGNYLESTEDHRPFGKFWKSLHPSCSWGGDFKNADGNHYSWGEK